MRKRKDPGRHAALDRRQAEEGRGLRQCDMNGDAGQEAGEHGNGEKIGNPARAQQRGRDQRPPDKERKKEEKASGGKDATEDD